MDLTDRKLLNLIQSKFPMSERPYLELGEELEIGEEEVISRLDELKRQNVVRQIKRHFRHPPPGLQDHPGGLRL